MKKNYILLSAALLLGCTSLFGQSKLAPNTRHYLQSAQERIVRSNPAMMLDAYMSVKEHLDLQELEKLGVKVNLNLGDILTAQIPANAIEKVAALPSVRYIQLAATPQQQLDKARQATGVDRIHQGEQLPQAYMGKDVVVGIIDAGFDYKHPAFYSADGKTLRIKRVWEQGNTKGQQPEKFSYGAEYTTPEAIEGAQYDINYNSHGTHVAAIAAGGYRGNDWYGVAGEADIVLVSKGDVTPNNVNISDAIDYIYSYAESVGKPCVINMSLGMEIGPHDGTSIFDQVSDRLQGAGKLLVGSAGNYKKMPLHVSKQFTGADDSPLQTMIDFKTKPSATNIGGEVDIWGEAGMQYDIQVVLYNYTRDEVVCASEVMDASNAEGGTQTFEITKNGTGKVHLTTEINPFNHKPHTYITLEVSSLRSRNALGLIITPKKAGEVHVWTDNVYVNLTDNDCEGWTKGNGDYTLVEIGGTGKKILSVGAYTTRNTYKKLGSTVEENIGEKEGDISSFSSTGPATDGRMKPEITAPGAYIISALNSHDGNLSSIPLAGGIENTNYCYGYMLGTSMAAPFVAGTVATWLQANPQLTPEDLRTILKQTAVKDEFTGSELPANGGIWGYGKLNAYEGLKTVLAQTGITPTLADRDNWVSFVPRHQNPALLFTQQQETVAIEVYDTAGKCRFHQTLNNLKPGMEFRLPTSKLAHGVYCIKVTGAQQHAQFKFIR